MSEPYIPKYLSDDETEVAKLLQRLNITSAKEVEMFKQLCYLKESKIIYNDALAITNTKDEEFVFTNFIQKIEKYQIVILRTEIKDNALTADYVRLCDDNSLIFFKEYIAEQIHSATVSTTSPLPTQRTLHQKEITISKTHFTVATSENLVEAFNKTKSTSSKIETEDDIIFAIPSHHNEIFLFTQSTLPSIIPLCIARIRGFFQEQKIVMTIGSIINLSSTEIETKIAYDDIIPWDEIVSMLYEKIDVLQSNSFLSNFLELIDLIIVLYTVIKPKLSQMKEDEKTQQAMELFNSKVLKKMRTFKNNIEHVQFMDILRSEAKACNFDKERTINIIEQFFENKVLSSEKAQQTEDTDTIIKIEQWYLHANLIVKIISERHSALQNNLEIYYANALKKYLLKKLPPSEIVFFDENIFEISVHQKVAEFDELYAKLLKLPIFLASMLSKPISTPTHSKNVFANMPASKRLSLFFNLRTKSLLPWYEIFNLRLASMIEQAHRDLSWYRKLIFVFTGRYKSMRERIVRVQMAYSTMRPTETKNESIKTNIKPVPPKRKARLKIKK